MPRRGQKGKARALPGDPTDPEGMTAWMLRFLENMETRNYSRSTLRGHRISLDMFLRWCGERDLTRPQDITRPILLRYQRHLFLYRKRNGQPLTASSQYQRLSALRMYFRWLTKQNVLLSNPAADLELPKVRRRLPKHVLTTGEAEAILALPDVKDPLGLRDRAVLEVLYSTGIRRMEVIALALYDLDRERGTLQVRQGKGQRDRIVPIGERALAWCDKYIRESRPVLSYEPDNGYLFLTKDGEPFHANSMSRVVAGCIDRAAVGKTGGCHLWRHTVATAMLENGADIRHIQEMLGHVSLKTTEIYTRVSIRKLKQVHTETHPCALLARRPGALPEPEEDPPEESLEDALARELEEETADLEDAELEDQEDRELAGEAPAS